MVKGYNRAPSYNIERCTPSDLVGVLSYHPYHPKMILPYKRPSTYCFAVIESGTVVAGYLWAPPAPGAAKGLCIEEPQAVLALSRMAALPRSQRVLNHVSKPLRYQMHRLIDRTRYPILVTYADLTFHTGHVYKCSGWKKGNVTKRTAWVDRDGNRVSGYQNGRTIKVAERLALGWKRTKIQIQEYTHSVLGMEFGSLYLQRHGWVREPIPGRVWRSGNQAMRIVKRV